MCIAIFKDTNGRLTFEEFENAEYSNPHGMGFAAVVDGELVVHKQMHDVESFYAEYKKYEEYPMVIHFRLATQGSKKVDNNHPFLIQNKIAMIHNGVVNLKDTKKEDKSDSRLLAEMLDKMKDADDILHNEAIRMLFDDFIGTWNKFVFLSKTGEYIIFNENGGIWNKDENVWYSNHSCKYSPRGFFGGKKKDKTQEPKLLTTQSSKTNILPITRDITTINKDLIMKMKVSVHACVKCKTPLFEPDRSDIQLTVDPSSDVYHKLKNVYSLTLFNYCFVCNEMYVVTRGAFSTQLMKTNMVEFKKSTLTPLNPEMAN